jgi:hypothetical protein
MARKLRAVSSCKTVSKIAPSAPTQGILIFDASIALEVLNTSSGYEGWNLGVGDVNVIALGGGELAVFERH